MRLNYSAASAGYLKATRALLSKLTVLIGYSSCSQQLQPSEHSPGPNYLFLNPVIISVFNSNTVVSTLAGSHMQSISVATQKSHQNENGY